MYRYAILGFGGLGKLHLTNLVKLSEEFDITLAAICSADPNAVFQNVSLNLGDVDISKMDFSSVAVYTDYKKLIDEVKPDFVLSTLPTYLHAEVAIYALEHGVHVFSEKPMALSLEDCTAMIDAANKNQRKLMIGQCLRFDPVMQAVKQYVKDGTYGKLYRAEFHRYSQTPLWTWQNWILDPKQSGGCIFDMHIHDTDLINWLFGMPNSLRSAVTRGKMEAESVFTQYFYDDGLLVTSAADWSLPQKFPFECRSLFNFEHACMQAKDGILTIYTDEEVLTPELPEDLHFLDEMRAFLNLALCDISCELTSPESVRDSHRLAMLEIESAESGETISL